MTHAYYCTVKRAERTAWLLGPFAEHAKAEAFTKAAHDKGCQIDPWMAFDAYGTSAIIRENAELATFPKGRLNQFFPEAFNQGVA